MTGTGSRGGSMPGCSPPSVHRPPSDRGSSCAARPHSSRPPLTCSWRPATIRPRSTPSGSARRGADVADALWLDGNALAGLLAETLGAEMTRAPRQCQSCGAVHPVGAHRLYRGAGFVLRCPACGDVAAVVVTSADRTVVRLSGTWSLEVPNTRP